MSDVDKSEIKIAYVCDRKACENCNPECFHTFDISHARNFKGYKKYPDGYPNGLTVYFEEYSRGHSLKEKLYNFYWTHKRLKDISKKLCSDFVKEIKDDMQRKTED